MYHYIYSVRRVVDRSWRHLCSGIGTVYSGQRVHELENTGQKGKLRVVSFSFFVHKLNETNYSSATPDNFMAHSHQN